MLFDENAFSINASPELSSVLKAFPTGEAAATASLLSTNPTFAMLLLSLLDVFSNDPAFAVLLLSLLKAFSTDDALLSSLLKAFSNDDAAAASSRSATVALISDTFADSCVRL
jgi:hypothetical protein